MQSVLSIIETQNELTCLGCGDVKLFMNAGAMEI